MMNETPRTTNRAEAERLLGVAEKLLHSRDFNGARDFAILALEAEPLLEGSDQLLAVAEVLLSAEKRINNHHDWYSILQVGRRSNDHDLIKKQYRRLALLLHPDKNKYPFSDQAFKLVADAWGVLSDSDKKLLYDNELILYSRVELSVSNKLPVRRSQRPSPKKASAVRTNNVDINSNTGIEDQNQRVKLLSFWTMCPYCYILYEYPRIYENCCLRCQNCERAFHAALIPSLPPLVPGKEAYYCSWGVFPLGFVFGGAEDGGKSATGGGFPNWMPPMFGMQQQQQQQGGQKSGGTNGMGDAAASAAAAAATVIPPPPSARVGVESGDGVGQKLNISTPGAMPQKRGRGRPRKYPVQT